MRTADSLVMNEPYESSPDTVFILPWHRSVLALASDCREAAIRFMTDSRNWAKAELAIWLINSASTFAGRKNSLAEVKLDYMRDVDSRLVERILENARNEVLAALDDDAAT